MLDMHQHMKHPEEIAELYEDRKRAYGVDIQRMRQMRELMNNEMPVPLPELSTNEQSTVANLALSGQDQLARRMASVAPTHYWPSTDPGKTRADQRAKDKPRVMTGWHEENSLNLKMGKRGRFFLSYATSPVILRPHRQMGIPKWNVVSPLDTFLPKSSFDDYLPKDFILTSTFTYKDLLDRFGNDVVDTVNKPADWDWDNPYHNFDVEFEVLEYCDEHEYSMILLGHQAPEYYPNHNSYERAPAARLTYAQNLVGRPLMVCPGRITLDAQLGHFDGIVGMYQTQAALMALTVIAQRRSVWPTEWLVPFPNSTEEPEIVVTPDPYEGIPGEIHGGTIETQNLDPAFRALEVMDRQAEAIRAEAGLPAEFGGQSATNIRTGRRGAQVMGAAIDFTISEAQAIFAKSLKEENKLAIAIDKAYFDHKKIYYVESRSFMGKVEYTPSELWDVDKHVVDYPFAGVDLQNLTIEGGQRVAMGTMSRESFMDMDPAIVDTKGEIQKIHRQGIQDAFLAGAQSLAANPEGPMQLPHIARLDKKLAEGKELYQAFLELQEEVQREQDEAAPPEQHELTQPGMAAPGQGVEQPEAIPEMDQSMNRMNQLLGSLGTTQMAQKYRK
jgi:hypothetical protein